MSRCLIWLCKSKKSKRMTDWAQVIGTNTCGKRITPQSRSYVAQPSTTMAQFYCNLYCVVLFQWQKWYPKVGSSANWLVSTVSELGIELLERTKKPWRIRTVTLTFSNESIHFQNAISTSTCHYSSTVQSTVVSIALWYSSDRHGTYSWRLGKLTGCEYSGYNRAQSTQSSFMEKN